MRARRPSLRREQDWRVVFKARVVEDNEDFEGGVLEDDREVEREVGESFEYEVCEDALKCVVVFRCLLLFF